MKRRIFLNLKTTSVITIMSNTDSLIIDDTGLPIPESRERIDLVLTS